MNYQANDNFARLDSFASVYLFPDGIAAEYDMNVEVRPKHEDPARQVEERELFVRGEVKSARRVKSHTVER
jgi:hypothetical protein